MTIPSRRQFLQGAAGFTLALPFLESIAQKEAGAGVAPYATNGRFVAFTTQHGGVWGANMWPDDAAAPNTHNLYSGHTAHHGTLTPTISGGTASLSPVLSADATQLTPALAAKMMLLRGIDVPWYLGHHTGGDLGNFAGHFDTIDDNSPIQELRPTIDQVMAYSSSFYPDLATIRQRSLHVGTHTHHAWGYANPDNPGGANNPVQPMPLSQSAMSLFNLIFVPEDPDPNPRPLIVDRVIEHYRRLHDGTFGDAARLSSYDRQRLDDHMDRLHDLQTRLNAVADCSDVPPLGGDTNGLNVGGYSNTVSDMISYYQLYNDVIVAAFMCGTSRIAVVNSGETWSNMHPGLCCNWHDNVAHMCHMPDGVAQAILVDAKRTFFQNVFLDLATKLDVEEANGITYLDNSLLFWTQESGSTTHDPYSLPIVTAGSGTGYFQTGQYVDYRNRNNMTLAHDFSPEHLNKRPGIPYHRWLANALTAMNVQPAEFERPGEHGYGGNHIHDTASWPQQYMDDASDPLPLIT